MDMDEEIKARIDAAKASDKDARLEDFQITASGNRVVLTNLKTRRAHLIYSGDSERAPARLFSAAHVREHALALN
jgi:hypothetical protein